MRLFTAFSYFFKILFNGEKAIQTEQQPTQIEVEKVVEKPTFYQSTAPAVQVLGLLQKEGRLIDFLQEDISAYSDQDVGAAVRDIHSGCQQVLAKHFAITRVLPQAEGERVTVEVGFDPSKIELQGEVTNQDGLSGSLLHAGWYAESIDLPTVAEGADDKVIAPAQVEV